MRKTERNKKLKRKRNRRKFLFRRIAALIVFIAVIVGITMSVSAFFYIDSIEVKGGLEIYSKQEVVEASGLKENESLFGFRISAVENTIKNTLPYVSTVSVKRTLPSKVTITVTESPNALVLPYQGGSLVLSQDFTIIKNVSFYDGKALSIYGINPASYSKGDVLADAEDEAKMDNLKLIISELQNDDLLSGATSVYVSDKLNLYLVYEDRLLAELGTSSNMERKILMLKEMVNNQLDIDEIGTLDLSISGRATFSKQESLDLSKLKVLPSYGG